MKVLVTGGRPVQVRRVRSPRWTNVAGYCGQVSFLVAALRDAGADVDWRPPRLGEDLSSYDRVIAFLPKGDSMVARYVNGLLWVLASRPDAWVGFDDWNVADTVRSYKNVAGVLRRNPESKVREDQALLYSGGYYDRLRDVIDRVLSNPFPWRLLVSVFDWGDRALLGLPEGAPEVVYYDPSPYLDVESISPDPGLPKEARWVCAALQWIGVGEWLATLPTSWPILRFGTEGCNPDGRKVGARATEAEVVAAYWRSTGILSPPRYNARSGWWRPRVYYGLRTRSVVYPECWREPRSLEEIERDPRAVVEAQREELTAGIWTLPRFVSWARSWLSSERTLMKKSAPSPAVTPAVAPKPARASSPDVLSVNTYGGSLLIGAKLAGYKVVASLEDCGFGQDVAKANFPEIPHVPTADGWDPALPKDRIVIAHPPCAAFSNQAKGTAKKFGLESGHFEETRRVMDYVLGNGAAALAIESVQGAYAGAAVEHEAAAERHGYYLYRILQNAATFGVPQWRPRFWAIFLRKTIRKDPRFVVFHTPRCVTVGQALAEVADPGDADPRMALEFKTQSEALRAAGVDPKEAWATPGMLSVVVARGWFPNESPFEVMARLMIGSCDTRPLTGKKPRVGYKFASSTPRVLDPDGLAPVILGNTFLAYKGRPATPVEYRRLMGFPPDYALDHRFRMWLSKGVVPAVAAWILDLLYANVTGSLGNNPGRLARGSATEGVRISPGETADVQISKKEWATLAAGGKLSREIVTVPNRAPAYDLFPVPPIVSKTAGPDARAVVEPASPFCGDDPLAALLDEEPPAPPPDPAPVLVPKRAVTAPDAPKKPGRKKRVEGDYLLGLAFDSASLEAVEGAFVSKKAVVLPPLVGSPVFSGRGEGVVFVHVRVQYEPPNAGGCKNDLDRIVARAAKKLGATWRRS